MNPASVPTRLPWLAATQYAGGATLSSAAPRLLLSVDFDFLVRMPFIEDFPLVGEELLKATTWDTDEDVPQEESLAAWRLRAARIQQLGLDPADAVRVGIEPSAAQLAHALMNVYSLPGHASIADSHAWGVLSIAELSVATGGPIDVVSFDSHHDCGYVNSGDTIASSRERAVSDEVGCDDWIYAAMHRGLVRNVTIVYPEWDGTREWDEWFPPTMPKRLRRRVRRISFDQWLLESQQSLHTPQPVGHVHLARSSEWTPPWARADEQFLTLADQLAPQHVRCLDCEAPHGLRVGGHDACSPRPWLNSARGAAARVESSPAG